MNSGLWTTVRLGIQSLALHKLRSLLTTLGVLFGTSSVIAMLAISEGGSREAQEQIRQLGSENVILRSIKPPDEVQSSNQRTRVATYGLLDEDLERIAETFPAVKAVVPVRRLEQEVRLGSRVVQPRVLATIPDWLAVTKRPLYAGRFLETMDLARKANVCVVGYELARYLSPVKSILGSEIRVGSNYFNVVGILLPRVPLKGESAKRGAQVQDEVFLPLTTAKAWYGDLLVKQAGGSRDMEQVDLDEIIVEVDGAENVRTVADATRWMMQKHHAKVDYELTVPLELLMRAEELQRNFSIVLGSIAGISLLVGGIGIMNVMLASVTERTREIGVRRALGAKRRHIVTQFLVETVVLSVGGGLLGILLGLAIPWVIDRTTELSPSVSPSAPLLAFGISAATGVIFGLYPAWRASRMDPVEALRHE
ncbi:MAG: ABC transporter permease [Planctomycetota bacterium]